MPSSNMSRGAVVQPKSDTTRRRASHTTGEGLSPTRPPRPSRQLSGASETGCKSEVPTTASSGVINLLACSRDSGNMSLTRSLVYCKRRVWGRGVELSQRMSPSSAPHPPPRTRPLTGSGRTLPLRVFAKASFPRQTDRVIAHW